MKTRHHGRGNRARRWAEFLLAFGLCCVNIPVHGSPLCHWDSSFQAQGQSFLDVTFARNMFVAVGTGGLLMSSPDAANWFPRDSGTTQPLASVTYEKDLFVANGDHLIISSADAFSWAPRYSNANLWIRNVRFVNGIFLAPSDSFEPTPVNQLLVSTNGLD